MVVAGSFSVWMSTSPTATSIKVDDIVHGRITLSPLCSAFARHRWFDRLRRIQQLGTVSRVFGRGTHTRWEHSVGTCHLAGLLLDALDVPLEPWQRNGVELAALCHDIGHGPYSHVFDRYVRPLPLEHEGRSQALVRLMYAEIRPPITALPPDKLEWAVGLITGGSGYLSDIVSNPMMDVDRLDYLLRDQYHLQFLGGVGHRQVLAMLRRCSIADGHLQYSPRDAGTLSALWAARRSMHELYYRERRVEACGAELGEGMAALLRDCPATRSTMTWLMRVVSLDESSILGS